MSEEVKKEEGLKIIENINKATEVAFIFDTTGSMASAIGDVRKNMEQCVEEMFELVPNLKIGFISHGDYCDDNNCYALLPLTDDKTKVYNFIRNSPNTSGGDAPECYELALNLAKSLGWSDKKGGKTVVMFGDAEPHEPDYEMNKDHLDWRKELADLKEMGIDVYPVQCLFREDAKANTFWSAIAEVHGTPLQKMENMSETSEAIMGYTAAAAGSETFGAYEKRIATCSLSSETSIRNAVLRDASTKYDTK